jgi:hypothetical protein
MELNRKLTIQEKKLIEVLLCKASIDYPLDWDKDMIVQPMNDGEMGSLFLFPKGEIDMNLERRFGQQVSDIQFVDDDGVIVVASLNIDDKGYLYELDIWKTNYEKLIKIPDKFEY